MNIIIKFRHEKFCPECFSSNLVQDFHHAEIFCDDCGLVVMDQDFSIDDSNYLVEREMELKEHLDNNEFEPIQEDLSYGDIYSMINHEMAVVKKLKKKKRK